jgi:sulfite reductase (NADPH) flavoprotein alpha-component
MPELTLRTLTAAALLLSWSGMTAHAWLKHRRKHTSVPRTPGKILVIHASQTGSAALLAQQAVSALGTDRAVAQDIRTLDAQMLQQSEQALFIASTSGEGDPPDSAQGFYERIMSHRDLNLLSLSYGVLALGDRRYKNFCGFGRQIANWLAECGAKPLFEPVLVDQLAPEALAEWANVLQTHLGAEKARPEASAHNWQLKERRLANPGSLGKPCFHVVLSPVHATAPYWSAGDIASVLVEPEGLRRDYSIASTPAEGVLRLLVRQHKTADGRLGAGSGWLTQTLAKGACLNVTIRPNPAFHAPPDNAPALFIGNGTGIAGLRALLRHRIERGRTMNWLIFGERQQAADNFYGQELQQWKNEGRLQRLDLTFSRDNAEHRYVHHALRDQAHLLMNWVSQGAYVYVCGSKDGMASDVDAVLRTILGEACYTTLCEQGRYRRDVY